jgi:hypothetical protein
LGIPWISNIFFTGGNSSFWQKMGEIK